MIENLFARMFSVAKECARRPKDRSIWSESDKRWFCPGDPGYQELVASLGGSEAPSISPEFKLVFVTASIGTLMFLLICVALTLTANRTPPPLTEQLIKGLFSLVQIGFGAICGLLGGKALN
ncbi:MAG: hypothetical protein AAGB10_16900 [Pseudomonadota bacterium]